MLQVKNLVKVYKSKKAESVTALNNVSIDFPDKGFVFLLGKSGSGKSTLINLIPRFYDITSGEILVDGVNIKEVSQHDLREKIGYVPQKGVLFSGTIESNLKYGDENLSEARMIKAAEIAQATEFISSKEKGFDTIKFPISIIHKFKHIALLVLC